MNTTHLVMFFFGGASAVEEAEAVVGGCAVAATIYHPGVHAGRVYHLGNQAATVFNPGVQQGALRCQ